MWEFYSYGGQQAYRLKKVSLLNDHNLTLSSYQGWSIVEQFNYDHTEVHPTKDLLLKWAEETRLLVHIFIALLHWLIY